MRLRCRCFQCELEEETDEAFESIPCVELNEDGYYEFACKADHRWVAVLAQEHFEVLFESGLMALVDGYTREAVSSFAVSLERFFEFYVRATLLSRGSSHAAFEKFWKTLSGMSERQYGAFFSIYMIDNGASFEGVRKSWVEFRNDVVHKGKIPSAAKVVQYGSYVFEIIRDLLRGLIVAHGAGIDSAFAHRMGSINSAIRAKNPSIQIATVSMPSFLVEVRSRSSGTGRVDLEFSGYLDAVRHRKGLVFAPEQP